MPNPTTPNIILEQPLRGTEVGTWDTPVNSNMGIIDQAFGGITTIALSSTNVTLASSQAQNAIIKLTGTLNSNVIINLPSIYKSWTIDNQLTNSISSFVAQLNSTSGTFQLGIAPGANTVLYDSSVIKYVNMGKLGEYWDYAGSATPTWVGNSTVQPWLVCNGTAFSSAVYPQLANLLGTTTLPDSRGRVRAALNGGTGRLTGVITDTVGAAGGDQNFQAHTHTGNGTTDVENQNHTHGYSDYSGGSLNAGGGIGGAFVPGTTGIENQTHTHNFSFTTSTAGTGTQQNVQPTYMGGITMIRAG